MRPFNNKKSALFTGVLTVIAFILTAAFWKDDKESTVARPNTFKPTTLAESGPFDIFVVETATLDAQQSVILSSNLPSDRAKIIYLAAEGDFIEVGDVVARFDPSPFEEDIRKFTNERTEAAAFLRQSQAEFRLAKQNGVDRVDSIRHQIELAKLKLDKLLSADHPARAQQARQDVAKAQADHRRVQNTLSTEEALLQQGLTKPARVQEIRDREAEFRAQLNLREEYLHALEAVTLPAERKQAQLELANLERELEGFQVAQEQNLEKQQAAIMRMEGRITGLEQAIEQAQAYLEATEITAPVSGILRFKIIALGDEKRKPQVGDSVWNRQGFAVIPDMSSMVAYLDVRESDLGKLEPGQRATVRPDAFPDLTLAGTVESIGTLASDASRDSLQNYFRVRIGLADTDQRLRPGMQGRASILARHYEDVVTVAVESVFYKDQQSVCFLWRNGRPALQPVKLGESDGRRIVVQEGLTDGQEVMLVYPEIYES